MNLKILFFLILIAGQVEAIDKNFNISFTNLSEINTYHTLSLPDYNSVSWGCTDLNQISVYWINGIQRNELDTNVGGSCGGNLRLQWRAKFNVPAGTTFNTTDTNGYFVNIKGDVVQNPKRNLRNVFLEYDSWEDGDYVANPTWTQSGGAVSIQNTVMADGLQAPFFNETANDNPKLARDQNTVPLSAFYEWWVRSADVAEAVGNSNTSGNLFTSGGINLLIDIRIVNSAFYQGGTSQIGTTAAVNNTWYKLKVKYVDNNAAYDVNIYSANGALLEAVQNQGTRLGNSGIIGHVEFNSESIDSYFDAYKAWSEPSEKVTFTIDNAFPVLTVVDFNYGLGFSALGTGGAKMRCTDDSSVMLDYNMTINDLNVFAVTDSNNSLYYFNSVNYVDGLNTIVFSCRDGSGNTTTDTNNTAIYKKLFYFVYDVNGATVKSKAEFLAGDVNMLRAYSYNLKTNYDLFTPGDVNLYYTGTLNDGIVFNIDYTNTPSNTTVRRIFDLKDVNDSNVGICYSPLTDFIPQTIYSSSTRSVIIKNAHTGCYIAAADTNFGYADNKALFLYTVPQSYHVFLITNAMATILTLIDGGAQNTVNLDLIALKASQDSEIRLLQDSFSVSKSCGALADCNTLAIYYRNYLGENSAVTIDVLNGDTVLSSTTNTTTPNNVTLTLDYTTWGIEDANILSLRATITRTTGVEVTKYYYFTQKVSSGPMNPWLAILLSVMLFIGGITLVAARFALGYFGLIITLVAFAILAFSPSAWYVTFMQSIMLIVMAYIGLTMKNETARLT